MSIDIFAPDRRSNPRIRQPYDNNYLLSNSYSNSMNNCNNSGVSFIAITKRNTIEVRGRRKEERMENAKWKWKIVCIYWELLDERVTHTAEPEFEHEKKTQIQNKNLNFTLKP